MTQDRDISSTGQSTAYSQPPVYLSVRQLAELTPWSEDEIDHKIRRGDFKRGVHFFQPTGRRRARLVFKWAAIVEFIEGRSSEPPSSPRQVLDVEAATLRLQRMLR
jgi:hypothetical protein